MQKQFINPLKNKILTIALVITLADFLYLLYFFYKFHYLPAPFVFDKSNTFMDFYNPIYWVDKNLFYTTYQSVYPPLNFFILKLYSFFPGANFNFNNSYELRENNTALTYALILTYALVLLCTVNQKIWKIYFSSIERFTIFIVFLLSAPFLFALERGNLIILGLIIFSIYIYSKSIFIKSLLLALLINLKPYFLILVLIEFKNPNDRLRFLIYFIACTTVIFLGLGYAVGINYLAFADNYIEFSKLKISPDGVISLPHSLSAMSFIPEMITAGSNKFLGLNFTYFSYLNLCMTLILILLITIKKISLADATIGVTIVLTNFNIGTGGYILLYYIPIIPLLIRERLYRIVALLMVIFIAPLDLIDIASIPFTNRTSYLGGNLFMENITLHLGLGSVIRPFCNFTIMLLFIFYLINKSKLKMNANRVTL